MSTVTIILLVIAVVAIAVAFWIFIQRRNTVRLRSKFGPEYDRTLQQEHGKASRAEAILVDRQKRVSNLNIRPLSPEERTRFAAEWRVVQEQFVDDPRLAVSQADALVNRALTSRGYPMADFDQRAADISVEHAHVVDDYRLAHDIAVRDSQGQASTEDLRRAMQHYRSLFEHVLETRVVARQYEEVHQ